MAYFFNGQLFISPAVMSQVNDSALANRNLSVGNILTIIGASTGGAPNTVIKLGSPTDATSMLRSGDLVDAAVRAFNPSGDTGGPETVYAIRVNPAVQAALVLLDSASAAAINLTSTDYGAYTNQIKVAVGSGTVSGVKVTTQLGTASYVLDNVGRNAFSIQYSGGQATASMTVTGTQVTLYAPNGTLVATAPLATYPTVQQLVDYLNTIPSFTASVLNGNGLTPSLNGLDFVTAQDVKTAPLTITANLQAVVDAINGTGEGFVTAVRAAGAGKPPNAVGMTYLSGGSDGAITNTQWSNAFAVLQSTDTQWVVPLSTDPAIHAMADAHVQFMSNQGRMERRAIVGSPLSTSDTAALPLAAALDSDRTSYVHLGVYDYNQVTGALQLYAPYITAAMVGGMFSGVNPGTALTNKTLRVQGVERVLRVPTDTDPLLVGGVMPIAQTPTGVKVVQSISTWLQNSNYNRVEQSVGWALDYVSRQCREAVDPLIGAPGDPITMSQAAATVESVLRAMAQPRPAGPGILVGDPPGGANPAYKNISVRLQGNVLAISFECSPVIPVNYIPVTIYAVPFSGSASA